jgi:hypothetical protein
MHLHPHLPCAMLHGLRVVVNDPDNDITITGETKVKVSVVIQTCYFSIG